MLKVHAKLRERAGHVHFDWTMGRLSYDYPEPLHTMLTMARRSCTAERATKAILSPNGFVKKVPLVSLVVSSRTSGKHGVLHARCALFGLMCFGKLD
jgi:hypothetical protein